ncbi:bifunctional biotin--[acetyl-CoA-carboxylase] ligase/biotin operon repressor BirA [Pseudomonas sp. ZM23]|uniref:Bifunctional ligase/repressor BirA n=1 Tax=Pseudomonas triclosanedens TaxID=2961893 RepID=A0ABY7A206_9PSED|nr:bifunctional biotin--[acetyl-CoA-carboxylase] ligase/biotin operon repressor BirA [Pseudomonas triclosanedens]MCP8467928.1 bifunctional biotin--[acetyl-CoA-carboxylase] ligase/biotin operon repressor BirA [Pseudomonas triclosanedens]MCP8473900.1 bifunctional biotin--[acetyl-CoA-carboxylase] ligase/biotin operon repressor BirA [Pseudomonas triclosanedens]MCP8479905.1 bifunctional biotin--[acetyl-CoA-carboxylase] ligase/biotin operon repressor BirA [Pseudomonas triclosanedens]WAI50295.1 bifunc
MQTLLKLLSDGRFHSGEELGALLGVSRSAVWKRLEGFERDYGVVIQRVRGRGYRLEDPLSVIAPRLNSGPWPLDVLSSVDSTNAEVLRRLAAGAVAPFSVLAERQTAGRGRRGRQWESPFGANLYYTLGISVGAGAKELEGLSLVVGLCVARAIRSLGVVDVGLKWPNDVLVGGKKIAGILLELTGDPADICSVAIGIGINVNMRKADAIDQPWTSVREALGVAVDRNVLLAALESELAQGLSRHREEGFTASLDEWESLHLWQGRRVTLSTSIHNIVGRALGVDERGALRLLVDGQEQRHSGGELSLRLSDDS